MSDATSESVPTAPSNGLQGTPNGGIQAASGTNARSAPPNLGRELAVQPHLTMPRFLLVVLAVLLVVYWSLALVGPAEGGEVFIGGAQGATLAAVVITAFVEIGVWVRRRPRS